MIEDTKYENKFSQIQPEHVVRIFVDLIKKYLNIKLIQKLISKYENNNFISYKCLDKCLNCNTF